MPVFLAVIVFLLLIYSKDTIMSNFDSGRLDFKDIYFAVFNWIALQVGFSFGIYALIVGKIKGFIYESKNTNSMKQVRAYLVSGYWVGMFVAVLTFLLIVMRPDLSKLVFYNYFIPSAWFSCFVFSFLCFIRIALIFQIIAGIDAKDKKTKNKKTP